MRTGVTPTRAAERRLALRADLGIVARDGAELARWRRLRQAKTMLTSASQSSQPTGALSTDGNSC